MKKFILSLIIFAYVVACSSAATIEEIIPQTDGIYGTFNQTKKLKDIDAELRSSGTFFFSKTGGIFWQTLKPVKNTIRIDTKSMTFYDKRDKLTRKIDTTANAKAGEISATISDALLGNFKNVEKFFSAEISGSKESWKLTLSALSEAHGIPIKKMTIRGDKQTAQSISFEDASGDVSNIVFASVRTDETEIPATFKKYITSE